MLEIIDYITKKTKERNNKVSLDLNNDGNVNIHDILSLLYYQKNKPKPVEIKDNALTPMSQIKKDLKNGLYFIHVDWCGWCVRTKPDIIKLQKKYPSLVHIYNVTPNTFDNYVIKNDFKLTHFPFMVIVKDNFKYQYRSQRTFSQLEKYFAKYII